MQKIRIFELDYMRAVAMLGVLGIHTGAFAVGSPNVNVHFFLLVDILTRFSVPIFFFISAFGLFLNRDPQKPFKYGEFLKRRIHVVLLPYLVWSLIYMLHQYLTDGNAVSLSFVDISQALFFGFGSYHLYFMVILVWFYLLMPVWRGWVQIIIRHPLIWLTLLYLLQTAFDYYSLSIGTPDTGYAWLDTAITYRLNYWVFHYLFIFMLGAVCATVYPTFVLVLDACRHIVKYLCGASLIGMSAYYYYLIYNLGYTCEATAFTLNQLHPLGIFYTLTMTLMLFSFFRRYTGAQHNRRLLSALRSLGANSYVIYLVHPLVMYYLGLGISAGQFERSVPVNIAFFLAAAIFSYIVSRAIYRLQTYFPPFCLLTGSAWPVHPQAIPKQTDMSS